MITTLSNCILIIKQNFDMKDLITELESIVKK